MNQRYLCVWCFRSRGKNWFAIHRKTQCPVIHDWCRYSIWSWTGYMIDNTFPLCLCPGVIAYLPTSIGHPYFIQRYYLKYATAQASKKLVSCYAWLNHQQMACVNMWTGFLTGKGQTKQLHHDTTPRYSAGNSASLVYHTRRISRYSSLTQL